MKIAGRRNNLKDMTSALGLNLCSLSKVLELRGLENPEYQKMFSKFSPIPQNELMGNGNFLAQAYTILSGLNVVIQSLSSSELMASQLNALGGAGPSRLWTTSFNFWGNINCMRYTHAARSIPRGPWEVRCAHPFRFIINNW
jgi:hypothetical protein